MLNREEYVAICKTCLKRRTNLKQDIVCSLTDAFADFETTCPDFEKDQLAIDRIERIKREEVAERASLIAPPLSEEKKRNGILYGILMIAGGIVWFIFGVIALQRVFFYPFILIIIGIVAIIKGLAEKAKELKKKPDTSNILDDKNYLETL